MADICLSQKQRIARQFSKAATEYDLSADVQADIAFDGIHQLPDSFERMLDIGCGTGRVTRQLRLKSQSVWAVDIAQGMLEYAHKSTPEPIQWIAADAEYLPFSENSFDGIFSSMALQWCEDFNRVFEEIFRVLTPKGRAELAIMCDGSFHQLNQCWQAIDSQPHTNRFPTPESLVLQAAHAGFTVKQKVKTYTTWHANVRAMLGTIKSIGANVVTHTGNQSRISKGSLLELEKHYCQRFAQRELLPLDYNVCFLSLEPVESDNG